MRILFLAFCLLTTSAFGQIVVETEPCQVLAVSADPEVIAGFIVLDPDEPPRPESATRISVSGVDGQSVNLVLFGSKGLVKVAQAPDGQLTWLALTQEKCSGFFVVTDWESKSQQLQPIEIDGLEPVPDPDPPKPDPPKPDPDDDTVISDAYGIGKIAYRFSVKGDTATAKSYQSIYKQAGDFLYGNPSLKFIASSDSSDAENPDRSVIAWINQEANKLPAGANAAWKPWRSEVSKAFQKSQEARQFTRSDWFLAFSELADALGAVK